MQIYRFCAYCGFIDIFSQSENFQLSSMILQRLLAGNIYREVKSPC